MHTYRLYYKMLLCWRITVQEMNYKDVVREFEADKSDTRENIFLQGKDTVHSNCAKLVPLFMA